MRLRLTPSGSDFFDLLGRLAKELVVGADALAQVLGADPPTRRAIAERLREVEHTADDVAREVIARTNRTFVTPFDRDDIYTLAASLDDCMDRMEEAAALIVLYEVDVLPSGVADLIGILQRAAELTAEAMPRLHSLGDLGAYWVEVGRLENEADRTYRRLLAEIFSDADDPLRVMKLKEVIDVLERAADAFEHVATTVESIALKES